MRERDGDRDEDTEICKPTDTKSHYSTGKFRTTVPKDIERNWGSIGSHCWHCPLEV